MIEVFMVTGDVVWIAIVTVVLVRECLFFFETRFLISCTMDSVFSV
jgi:hypothetical protein